MAEKSKEKFQWRVINLFIGSIYVLLSIYVAINPGVAVASLILILSFVLLLSGGLRIINAFFEKGKNGFWRIFYLFFGIFTVMLGLSVIIFQEIGLDLLVLILAIGLMTQGIVRIGTGIRSDPLPNWLQFVFILSGIISILLAFFVIISTDIAILTLTIYLSYGFLLNGFTRLLIAITGNNPYKTNEF